MHGGSTAGNADGAGGAGNRVHFATLGHGEQAHALMAARRAKQTLLEEIEALQQRHHTK